MKELEKEVGDKEVKEQPKETRKMTYLESIDSRGRNGFTKKQESSNHLASDYPEGLPPIFNYALSRVVY